MRKKKTDRHPDLKVSLAGEGHRTGGLRNTQVRSGLRSGCLRKAQVRSGLRSGVLRDLRPDL
jgi:hypothetical protein